MLSIGIIGIMAVLFVVGVYAAKRWFSNVPNGLILAAAIPMVIGTGLLFFIRTDDSTGSPHAAVDREAVDQAVGAAGAPQVRL